MSGAFEPRATADGWALDVGDGPTRVIVEATAARISRGGVEATVSVLQGEPRCLLHRDVVNVSRDRDRVRFVSALHDTKGTDIPAVALLALEEVLRATLPSRPRAAKRSQADLLTALVDESEIDLFHTPDGDAFAAVPHADGHVAVWPVRGTDFQRWLVAQYFARHGSAPNGHARADARETIAARACQDGDEEVVHLRIAAQGGAIYLDLANERWEVVEITAAGWRVRSDSPVRFQRPQGMRPLPTPVRGGSLDALRDAGVVHVTDDGWILLKAWLLGCLRPDFPFTALALLGEQGSGKTWAAGVLRRLIDPNLADLRRPPRSDDDLYIAATHGWVIGLENVSTIPQWLNDALCTLATGGGLAKRALFTNSDEVILNVKRPIVLTSITRCLEGGDLLDRALLVELPRFADDADRLDELELGRRYDALRPGALGALLDAAVAALANVEATMLARPPRMADFARWVVAGEAALGIPTGEFLRVYRANRASATEIVSGGSPLPDAIRSLLEQRPERAFAGTATELLTALDTVVDDEMRRARAWPKAANALSGQLKRLAPALRAEGVEIDETQTPGSGSRKRWTLRLGSEPQGTDATDASTPRTGGAGDPSAPPPPRRRVA